MTTCPECGTAGEGRYCAQCGTRLLGRSDGRFCTDCGEPVSEEALYCAACGAPVGERPRKPTRAYLPWVLVGVALVAFSVVIAFVVQGSSGPRMEGAPLTGGVPGQEGGAEVTSGAGAGGAMPSAEELAEMSPREAADRLFDRSMQLHETGDVERGRFFARMGIQAYGRVPPAEMDADARLHLGLLHLTVDETEAAALEAEAILSEMPAHPYGLFLAARAAERRGDATAAADYRSRLRRSVEGEAVPEAAWAAHRAAIERTLAAGGQG